MLHHSRSVQLDKSLGANDEQVPVYALLDPVDGRIWNHVLESIADGAVKPCASTNPQNAAAGAVKPGDLIA
jgi:hypothetical protein